MLIKGFKQAAIFVCYFLGALLLLALILFGWMLKHLYRGKYSPETMTEGNCWAYAIPRFVQSYDNGVYILIRKSRANFLPHVQFTHSIDGLPISEFEPAQRSRGWKSIFRAVWFRGFVRYGTGEDD